MGVRKPKPFVRGDEVVCKGYGKHSRGVFVRELPQYSNLVEYRCDYNKGIHTVLKSLLKHKPKHRVPKGSCIEIGEPV